MNIRILLLSTFLFLNSFSSFGQFFYTDHTTKDDVEISYKWKDVEKGPKELRLKLKNENTYPVMVNLDVDYYMNGILQESSILENFCMKATSMVAGKLNGVIFTTTELTNEDLESDNFELEFNNIKIVQTEKCPEKEED